MLTPPGSGALQEGPNFDSMEVTQTNPGSTVSASSHGIVHITADNGYILYINGERIGAGGQATSVGHTTSAGNDGFTDWRHTDAWSFIDSCDTPTTYAIHAVDESGIAAVLGDFTHCGRTVTTSDQWRCAPLTSMTVSDHGGMTLDGSGDRTFVVGPTPMDFESAR